MKNKYKTIKCPDYGDIVLQEYIKAGDLDRYFETSTKELQSATDQLILSIIVDENIKIDRLSNNDVCVILKEITSELEVDETFEEKISGNNYYKAFKIALESSDYFKYLNNSKKSAATALNYLKTQQTAYRAVQNSLSGFFAAQKMTNSISKFTIPNAFDISKFISPPLAIQKQISIYQKTAQNLRFPITYQLLDNKSFEIDFLVKQAELFRNINKLSMTNIEHIRNAVSHNKSLFNPVSIISKRYNEINNIYNLSESVLKSITQNINILKQPSNINWTSQLKYAAELIANSNSAIGATHNYFTNTNAINSINTDGLELNNEEKREFNELTSGLNESEIIIQDNAGSSLLYQKNYGVLFINRFDSIENKLDQYIPVVDHFKNLLNPKSFSNFLDEFAEIVSREYWQQFWKETGNKFNSCPESIAKSSLALFLFGRYSNVGFIGQELAAGKGFIDLLVNLFGMNYLIELKVIGSTTPVSWAKSGINQLNNYMKQYNLDKGYLVLFDGRKTERGSQLDESYDVSNGRIYIKKIKIYYT